ncbi:hypothetical protein ABPG75_007557 [Micractinium tetrahymenae]
MQPADFTALPQRPLRERRSSKRAKLDDGEPAAVAASGGGDAAAAEGQAAAGADQQQAQGEPQMQDQQDVQQQLEKQEQQLAEQGEPAAGADATPQAAQLDLPAYRSAAVGDYKFEYLDHTADVQLHAWGETLREAFENVALCMFNYMTPLKGISLDAAQTRRYEAEGHDLQSLLFNFLDEVLFAFSTEFFVAKRLRITRFARADQPAAPGAAKGAGEGDEGGWRIEAEGEGERFDRARHACGTEVKAITYSAMQINEKPGDAEVFVIVDI